MRYINSVLKKLAELPSMLVVIAILKLLFKWPDTRSWYQLLLMFIFSVFCHLIYRMFIEPKKLNGHEYKKGLAKTLNRSKMSR